MQTDDTREKLQARIAEDLRALQIMMPEGEIAARGYLQLIADGKLKEARELLSLLNCINDNIQRLGPWNRTTRTARLTTMSSPTTLSGTRLLFW